MIVAASAALTSGSEAALAARVTPLVPRPTTAVTTAEVLIGTSAQVVPSDAMQVTMARTSDTEEVTSVVMLSDRLMAVATSLKITEICAWTAPCTADSVASMLLACSSPSASCRVTAAASTSMPASDTL